MLDYDSLTPPSEKMSVPETKKRSPDFFKKILENHGLTLGPESQDLLDRMALLDERTGTFEDETRANEYADQIFAYLGDSHTISENRLSPEKKQHIQLATLLTDIGKTGPHTANPAEREVITALFAITEDVNVGVITLGEYIERFFPNEKTQAYMQKVLEPLLEKDRNLWEKFPHFSQMTMRAFFNLHAGWTYNILRENQVPIDVTMTAANHHMLEGVNPNNILDHEGSIGPETSISRPVDQREIFVILLDKYDARRNRAVKRSHEEAIDWLEMIIKNNAILTETFKDRPEIKELFLSCLRDLEHALVSTKAIISPEDQQQKAA